MLHCPPAPRRRELLLPLCRLSTRRAIGQVDNRPQPDSQRVQDLSTIAATLCGARDICSSCPAVSDQQPPHSGSGRRRLCRITLEGLAFLQGVEGKVSESSQSSGPCTAGGIIARLGVRLPPTIEGSSGRRLHERFPCTLEPSARGSGDLSKDGRKPPLVASSFDLMFIRGGQVQDIHRRMCPMLRIGPQL